MAHSIICTIRGLLYYKSATNSLLKKQFPVATFSVDPVLPPWLTYLEGCYQVTFVQHPPLTHLLRGVLPSNLCAAPLIHTKYLLWVMRHVAFLNRSQTGCEDVKSSLKLYILFSLLSTCSTVYEHLGRTCIKTLVNSICLKRAIKPIKCSFCLNIIYV